MVMKFLILRRYQWPRIFLMLILMSTFIGLFITLPSFGLIENPLSTEPNSNSYQNNFPYINYPAFLQEIRRKEMSHMSENAVYLDYTGAGVYSDYVFNEYTKELKSNFYLKHSLKSNLINITNKSNTIRDEILQFVNANPEEYSVVFVASATQALKLIGEVFPWDKDSIYAYSRYNHNSVLGIRRYLLNLKGQFQSVNWPLNLSEIRDIKTQSRNNLFAFPLEENFAGMKVSKSVLYEITHDEEIRRKFILLGDAAAFLPTNTLNLTETPLDAISLSFYKIIGYPNTGALIIRNDFIEKIRENLKNNIHQLNDNFLEDDEVPLEMNLAIPYGLRFLNQLDMKNVNKHVWTLTKRLYKGIDELCHSTGEKVAKIYGNHVKDDPDIQGGIVAFNLRRLNGSFFGYSTVVSDASESGIHLRGGCHCNPGACFESMGISESKVRQYYDNKESCGDKLDVVDGIPLGAVRASLGWASTEEDIDTFIQWIKDNYVF